jgi:hypothetical protein
VKLVSAVATAAALALGAGAGIAVGQGAEGPTAEAVLADPGLRLPPAESVPVPLAVRTGPIPSAENLAGVIGDLGERRSAGGDRLVRLGFIGGVIRLHQDPADPLGASATTWAAQFASPQAARAAVHAATWIARGGDAALVETAEVPPAGARLVSTTSVEGVRSIVIFAVGDWLYGIEMRGRPEAPPDVAVLLGLAAAVAQRVPDAASGPAQPLDVTDELRAELRTARARGEGHAVGAPTPGSVQAASYDGAEWAIAAFDGPFGDLELFRRVPGTEWRALGDPGGPGCPRIPTEVADLWGLGPECPPGSSLITDSDDHDRGHPDLSPFRGPGMWVWEVGSSGGPAAIARTAKEQGFRSVFIKSGDGTRYWRQFDAAARALRAEGIHVCGWQYVVGRRPAAEAAVLARAVRRGADCLIVDAESEFKARDGRYAGPRFRKATRYMASLRRKVGHRVPVAFTSFAYADLHRDFPYSAFLGGKNGADVNMPQVYWGAFGVRVTTAMRRTLRTNSVYGPIAPIAGTYRRERPADLRTFRCIAANSGAVGVSYWSLQHTRRAQLSALAMPTSCRDSDPIPREYPTTRIGTRGDTVVWLQSRLRAWGSPVPRTGNFLRRTRAAVRAFQSARGLEPTGVVDPRTWDLLLRRPTEG